MDFSENLDFNSWITEALSRDSEAITRALHDSLSNNTHALVAPSHVRSPTPTTSSVQSPDFSGSDPGISVPKRRNGIANGKITKRKSRASKRATTTIITADPSDFRRLVQQVTGIGFGNPQVPVAPVLKPEPHRAYNRFQECLPTLDTSAFLVDHRQQYVGPGSTEAVMSYAPPVTETDGGAGLNFESSLNFPTLESWKVM